MLDLRLYRVTLLPFAIGLIVVAFSLHPRPSALPTPLPPQTFDALGAAKAVPALAKAGSDPGSTADDALARSIEANFADAAFPSVRLATAGVETTAGMRTIDTVIATRAGTGPAIALIADRGQGAATATLLGLATIYGHLVPHHPLILVSTAGGASGMAAAASDLPPGIEAAIVIGAPATTGRNATVAVLPWSTAGAIAPSSLRATVAAAMTATLGVRAVAGPTLTDQLARLALPVTTGEQGPLEAAGIPAVAVTADGESASQSSSAVPTAASIAGYGQGLMTAVAALDNGPALPVAPVRDLSVGSQILDGWGVRLVSGLLVLSLLACCLDVLARARRRRAQIASAIRWVLSLAVPFALAGLFTIFLGLTALLPTAPAVPVTSAQLGVGGTGAAALVSIALLFVLAWALRAAVRERTGAARPAEPVGGAAALLAIGSVLAFVVWLGNPYTALLVIVPLHVWLVALTREAGRSRLAGAAVLILSLAVPLAAVALICAGLGISPFGLLWTMVLLAAGGGLSLGGLLIAAVAAACVLAAAVLLVLAGRTEPLEVSVRGSLGYAGPGSLRGTQSALRR